MTNKTFIGLKPFPKNKESRVCYITDEIIEILLQQKAFKLPKNDFVFHVEWPCVVSMGFQMVFLLTQVRLRMNALSVIQNLQKC